MTERFWGALLEKLERPDLGEDPRFRDNASRRRNLAALTALLDAEFRRRTTAEWLGALSGALPVGPVYGLAEALESPFAKESGMIRAVPHPLRPDLRLLASPIKIDGERPPQAVCPPAGADDEALLGAPPDPEER
jgi:crotonobetainyl-CoA:carnitine CoA-transferase CaiB-like acyl-CoA transferase